MELMENETAPRERKIRRGIVILSSCQVTLGAVIIGMSFTAFASTSSSKVRESSPYWAGFMTLFTGSVGFLTWKQLSIVSIGIYTFLSTACVVVSLVATVLTGDSAGFLKTLAYCSEVKFEHACHCCVTNTTCTSPHKFTSVRDCGIINGLLKDIMYSLCVANILCCVMSLTVTLAGCTLGAQYSRYSQRCTFRWSHSPPRANYDHRHDWSPYPIDPISNLPPWAPPIYCPVPNTPREVGCGYERQPPTVFDSVDFPPPYTSREPSIAGQLESRGSIGIDYPQGHGRISWNRLGYSVFRFFGQGAGTVSEDSFDYIDRTDVRILGSSSGTSEGVLHHHDMHEQSRPVLRRSLVEDAENEAVSHVREVIPSTSTESDSETPRDVFTSNEACTIISDDVSHNNLRRTRTNEHVGARRHSWTPHPVAQSSCGYHPHDEIHNPHIPPNMNPWARSMSDNEANGNTGSQNGRLHMTKPRSNSTPCYPLDRVMKECDNAGHSPVNNDRTRTGSTEATQVDNSLSTATCVDGNRSLFRHFTESSKSSRNKPSKKRRRPRNNPGHILEHGSSRNKEGSTRDRSGLESTEYRETTL